jgi:ADP-ribosylglycohydrolase
MIPTFEDRITGSLYGSLVGDALGVPVEFAPRATRRRDPVMDMRGYGTHGQPPGTWSDDGALLLCSVESLALKGFDPRDMGERFVQWYCRGLWSAHGTVFDIGIATRGALARIESGVPAEEAGGSGESSNGNGSLMRILPVILASLAEPLSSFAHRIARASAITHRHRRSQLACTLYGLLVRELLAGQQPETAWRTSRHTFAPLCEGHAEHPAFQPLLHGDLAQLPEDSIESSGYVMHTLTAAVWCLLTTGTFSGCVLKAVNLGEDTDTTACVAGALAGAAYGINAIPSEWLAALPRQEDLKALFASFLPRCSVQPSFAFPRWIV